MSQVVVQTMMVDRKSNTASTRLANTDMDGTDTMTMIFPASSRKLAAKLT